MSTPLTWLCLIVGWALVALGGWLLFTGRGLKAKRKEGDRHCQRCGYDMVAIATLTCPECGRAARNEKELAHSLHRGRWRTLGIVTAIGGWALIQTPGMIAYGWAAAVPDPLLALIAPSDLSAPALAIRTTSQPARLAMIGWPPYQPSSPASPPAPPTPYPIADRLGDTLFDEVWRRFNNNTLGQWSGETYLRRLFTLPSDLSLLQLPPRWGVHGQSPVLPPVATARMNANLLTADAVMRPEAEPTQTAHFDIKVTAGARRFTLASFDRPLDVRLRASLMDRVQGPDADAAAVRALAPGLLISGADAKVVVGGTSHGLPLSNSTPFFVRARIRILLDGEELGHTFASMEQDVTSPTWEQDGEERAVARAADVVFDLVGDPVGAADIYMHSWSNNPTAWAGRTTVKPRVVVRRWDDPPGSK